VNLLLENNKAQEIEAWPYTLIVSHAWASGKEARGVYPEFCADSAESAYQSSLEQWLVLMFSTFKSYQN